MGRKGYGGVSRHQMEEVTCGLHVRLCNERDDWGLIHRV